MATVDGVSEAPADFPPFADGLAHPLGLDVFGGRVYWTDSKTNDLNVLVKEQNYTVRAGVTGLLGISIYHNRRQPVMNGCDLVRPAPLPRSLWVVVLAL